MLQTREFLVPVAKLEQQLVGQLYHNGGSGLGWWYWYRVKLYIF